MATVTAADLPEGSPGATFHNSTLGDPNIQRERDAILARGKVLYKGHPRRRRRRVQRPRRRGGARAD